ncbi:MAG: hypothetical protein HYR96_05035 [Deltaproteobacteria bacterium]|nr:hypothetical protein [Deltaproteobacteria bacterium]MBI3294548.1 hypothetical protein [Deltaproteobacteria bacterium]
MQRLTQDWERRATSLKGSEVPRLGVNAATIFRLLLRYSNWCRRRRNAPGLKLFLDGQGQYTETILELLPVAADRSLLGYHRKMENAFPDYCLICDELLALPSPERTRIACFVSDLHRAVGRRFRFAEMGLYLGNYHKTPFGVHVDGCGVISFPVVGRKSFKVWSPRKGRPRADSGSQRLAATPREAVYWPSTYWHIAESKGDFSATWSLGFWIKARRGQRRRSWIFP